MDSIIADELSGGRSIYPIGAIPYLTPQWSDMTWLLLAALYSASTPESWLQEAAAAERQQTAKRAPFVYRERQSNWMLDGLGRQKKDEAGNTKVYEHIFLEGAPYRQLIERDGKPIRGSELAKREAARKKEAAVRQENRRARKPFLPGNRNVRVGNLEEVAASNTLKLAGEEVVDGHPCVLIEAEPNGRMDTPRNKELQSYRQRFWIHRELKVLVRRRIEVIGPDSEIALGSILMHHSAPLAETEIWFANRSQIDFGATLFGVKKVRGLQIHEFFDYRRFQVESTITAEGPK